MGRASRKTATASADRREHWTDTHPDRHLWSPGRLAQARTQTQEEYEALYGRGQTAPVRKPRRLVSSLFPEPIPTELMDKLGQAAFSAEERIELLAAMRVTGEIPEDDPVLRLLWSSEVMRVEEEISAFEEMGLEHWAQGVDLEDLRSIWLENVIGRLAHPQRQARTVLRRGQANWWQTDAEGTEILREQSSSLLQAAIYQGLVDREDLAIALDNLQGGSALHNQFFADNILWDSAWRKAYMDSPFVSETVWNSLAEYVGVRSTVNTEHEVLAAALPLEAEEAFRKEPLGNLSASSPYDRALHTLSWERVQEGLGEEEIERISRDLLEMQIVAIADQGGLSSAERFASYSREPEKDQSFPLDNLQPLFEKAGQEALYRALEKDCREKVQSDPHLFRGDPLREAILAGFDPGPGLHGITMAIEQSFRRHFL